MLRLRGILSFACLLACLFIHMGMGEAATVKKSPVAKDPPVPAMAFAIVRSSVVGCEPDCPEWISAEGQIVAASPGQFRKILKRAGKLRLPVIITSQGGDVEAALAIGQMIRERKLDVVVGWTLFTGCSAAIKTCKLPKQQNGVYAGVAMTGRAYCFSACPFILAAGQKRVVGSGAIVGVHEITTQPITQHIRYNETYRIVNGKKKVLSRKVISRKSIIGKLTTKLSKPFNNKLKGYLNTMGVNLAMLDLLHLAPPSSIHNVTIDEMKSTKLVTDFAFATDLVANSLCKTSPPAGNCKVEKQFNAVLVSLPAPAKAVLEVKPDNGGAMDFAIVRSSAAGCEPLCQEWIFSDGKITADTPSLFKKVLARVKNRRLPIVIRAYGGDALAAMAMGRMIRGRKLDVIVATTLYVGCPVRDRSCRSEQDKSGRYRGAVISNEDYCNSACVFILAAGQKRLLEARSSVGVHQLLPQDKLQGGKVLEVALAKKLEVEFQEGLGKYLDEMGVDRTLLAIMDKVPPLGLHYLSQDELAGPKLMTERVPIASLAINAACQPASPADSCVKR